MRKILLGTISLLAAAAIWLPILHLLYTPDPDQFAPAAGVPREARQLVKRFRPIWEAGTGAESTEIDRLHRSNPEWDFMCRSYLVWSLANIALREPETKDSALELMDRIIDDTLRLEASEGLYYFLMPYARNNPWVMQPPRSLFIDGEIALMLAVRRVVAEKPTYKTMLAQRLEVMLRRMQAGEVLSAESYPDECWTFCNTVALAAIRISDYLDGTDHSKFLKQWVAMAKRKLVDPKTGLLISYYTVSGRAKDGPEGSSIWMASHCLQLVDEDFAEDQYRRARKELGRTFMGFGYAREWPQAWVGRRDVDSGTVIPGLDLSPSSSGQALVAASAFGDRGFVASLAGSLKLGGFPHSDGTGLRYCASNGVGDAVVLYSMVLGPVWDRVRQGGAE